MDIIDRLSFDSARCLTQFSKGVAGNIDEAIAEIKELRANNEWLKQKLIEANERSLIRVDQQQSVSEEK